MFAMKHSGLAAELHVVHWPFLVDTEGKVGEEGESREIPVTRAHSSSSHAGSEPSPAPALPAACWLCPAARGCRDRGTHPLGTRLHVCSTCGPDEHLAEGQRPGLRPPQESAGGRLSIQLTNPSQAGTVAKSQTAHHTRAWVHPPLPSPPPPQTARNRTSLIFQVCSCLTLEKPMPQMSLMLNKEKC